ncbi:hypothetical protein FSP39_024856 [Pinctada imbricata]|uniref:NIPSNAP domain-containing protein n=1 Tax=Pinctada imbricata TaxID=66713 RepID=A0AA88XKC6_PINIB|nr:hypothetical protein FSP39_024856 [Pinctada imbricata]
MPPHARTTQGINGTGHIPITDQSSIVQLVRKFSTTAALNKVYEWRAYSVEPKEFKSFIELTSQWIHLRTNHSPLVGYWISEIGGINDVVHLWEYDNLDQRAAVRLALSQDQHWISNYISKMTPMLARQENSLLQLVGPDNLSQPDIKGVYEIQQFSSSESLEGLQGKKRGDAKLLGTFQGITGPMGTAYQLWYHQSPNHYMHNITSSNATSNVPGHSRLLLPTAWSPLK